MYLLTQLNDATPFTKLKLTETGIEAGAIHGLCMQDVVL